MKAQFLPKNSPGRLLIERANYLDIVLPHGNPLPDDPELIRTLKSKQKLLESHYGDYFDNKEAYETSEISFTYMERARGEIIEDLALVLDEIEEIFLGNPAYLRE
jgi:hypothetical protein